MTRRGQITWAGARLFLVVLLVYSICPPFTSNDSYFVVPTALSLLRHASTAVDEFVPGAPPAALYAVECVPQSGPAAGSGTLCPGGHWYNYYPVGVPVVALPAVGAMALLTGAARAVFPALPGISQRPIISAFLAGDLVGGNPLAQLWSAALIGALAAWLMFLVFAQFFAPGPATWLALLFAFGTSQFSIASRNLFQHGPSVLMLSAALYVILRAKEEPRLIRYAALPLAMAFVVRPSNFISVVVLTAYVAWRYRRECLAFLLWALPVAVPFLTYNLAVRHSWFPTYYHYDAAGRNPFWFGFEMNLVSPSRGLLVYVPVVIVAVYGMVVAWRRRWYWPLAPFLAAILVLHMLLIATYWSGHSYGPRYWSDITPFWAFFLVPAVLEWRTWKGQRRTAGAVVFLLLAGWGVLVHTHGATSVAAQQWNVKPVNVDAVRSRVFDWSDPQFLRGLR